MSVVTIKKEIDEIKKKLIEKDANSLMVIGCGKCAKSSKTGGPEEVIDIKEILSKNGFKIFKNENLPEVLDEGLCRYSDVQKLSEDIIDGSFDSILVLACGAGLKAISDNFNDKTIISGVNTIGIGIKENLVCLACGDCSFDNGICNRLSIIEEINNHLKKSYN
ncbi:hypothetical protein [Methanococcus aeolicus]|uniref:Methylene-tetrahydrofolate reductase C-terminal domain-containing protein n=1 Tax=Methanococcus aeolicus (strain ATCC BAA-1280 / DSM 17508 / OCM 812 / Nankai-3) TaxID=419665 RepID=A6UTR8_META3|nr:hypothetical protein [Methanococcus aeolicus]ABR55890.1 hypothetical protein Maeo_0302 [Methanococcus aeolicus Nankai-3]UXM84005.1 hypothetical protein N6C89_04345 [Methanococcus aeolicus]